MELTKELYQRSEGKKMTKPSDPKAKPLTKNMVLLAAIELADAEGIESLSMRKLGEKLHIKAMSLYNHVKNKGEVLDGIIDIVVGKMQIPAEEMDWKSSMRERAFSAHDILLLHPWAARVIMSRSNPGPAMLRYIDTLLGCFRKAGFSIEVSDHAWNTLDSYIYGYTLQELNYAFDMTKIKEVSTSYLPYLPTDEYPYMSELTKHIATTNYKKNYEGVHDFAFGLDLFLNGLEKVINKN